MTEIFSEIYNCYYQIIKSLITTHHSISKDSLRTYITEGGYEESVLYLLPKLMNGDWDILEKTEDGNLTAKLSSDFYVPLTNLQRSYLKALLSDEKIGLFMDENEHARLWSLFSDVEPLYKAEDFCYYDRFRDGDDYTNAEYRQNFRLILTAIKNKQYVDILYEPVTGKRLHHHYLPCKLEYSVKNDCFRLLAINKYSLTDDSKHDNLRIETLRLSRVHTVTLMDQYEKKRPDINHILQQAYYKEPVTFLLVNERNALERAMLQFANYEKNTRRIEGNLYECQIYYNKLNETELLIEVLSFGPMLKVTGNDSFLQLIRTRLKKQQELMPV